MTVELFARADGGQIDGFRRRKTIAEVESNRHAMRTAEMK